MSRGSVKAMSCVFSVHVLFQQSLGVSTNNKVADIQDWTAHEIAPFLEAPTSLGQKFKASIPCHELGREVGF